MIKKRSRPTARIREPSPEVEEKGTTSDTPEGEKNPPLEDILELRRLRRARQGIDATKLFKGDVKKKKKKKDGQEEESAAPTYGLIGGSSSKREIDDDDDDDNKDSKARKAVRQNNFTQQTNALDVDRHMMAYIEENMKTRRGGQNKDGEEGSSRPYDAKEELFKLPEKYKTQNIRAQEEGSVTNSISMLAAIPEVDLGMDTRLKNIEETEKAKRIAADSRGLKRQNNDEEHLAATRFFKPNTRHKSDADIVRDAKLEAMGLRAEDHEPRQHREKVQTATDEMVMERFKKRMRK